MQNSSGGNKKTTQNKAEGVSRSGLIKCTCRHVVQGVGETEHHYTYPVILTLAEKFI